MNFSYIDTKGDKHEVDLKGGEMLAAVKTGNPVAEINRKFPDADLKIGTAFAQFGASIGLARPGANNPFGLKSAKLGDIMEGKAGFSALNVQQDTQPFGEASRAFVNVAIINEVMAELQKDRTTDANVFDNLIANTISVETEHFEQPVIDYRTPEGPEKARASRVVQGAEPPRMMFFKTADRIRRIGSWNIGMEWSEQALRNTTLDYVALTLAHYLRVERDDRVYRYINELWNGNNDMIVGAVSGVTSASLDAASTGGVLTHKAWIKFLARNRKYRRITHLVMDIDTYLKVEGRKDRPGSNSYDPSLARIDPQGLAMNVGFGNDVRIFLVDPATEGGPVPANTIYALDATVAITRVVNTAAAYQAVEEFAMKRTSALRMDFGEEVFRTMGDEDLRPFDALVIS